jgi:hypothetical protein
VSVTPEDGLKYEIAKCAWQVAGHISTAACLAVMLVLRTRTGEGGDWYKEIRALSAAKRDIDPDTRDPMLRNLLEYAEGVFDGTKQDRITNEALYFSHPEIPQWFETEGKERTASLALMVFWK